MEIKWQRKRRRGRPIERERGRRKDRKMERRKRIVRGGRLKVGEEEDSKEKKNKFDKKIKRKEGPECG